MSTPGFHGGPLASGQHHIGKPMPGSGGEPSDRTSGPAGGKFGGGFNANGAGRNSLGAATRAGAQGAFTTGAAASTSIKSGDGPTAFVSPGDGRGLQPVPGRRHGAPHGGDPAGPGGSSPAGKPGDGPGATGFGGRAVDGLGKGPGYKATTRSSGPADGIGNDSTSLVKTGTNEPAISDNKASKAPEGPMLHSGGDTTGATDPGTGSAVNAVFTAPSANSIRTPEDLRTTAYEVTIRVRVVLQANGTVSVTLPHASAYPALDAQVKAVCAKIHFKPAMLDGKPVDEVENFNFHLKNVN